MVLEHGFCRFGQRGRIKLALRLQHHGFPERVIRQELILTEVLDQGGEILFSDFIMSGGARHKIIGNRRKELVKKGHTFDSETDTEVAVHLIEENLKHEGFASAVRDSFNSIKGFNAIVVLNAAAKEIIAAKTLEVSLPDGSSIGELKDQLIRQYPAFLALRSLSFAANDEYRDDNFILSNEVEVIIIPPVSGG